VGEIASNTLMIHWILFNLFSAEVNKGKFSLNRFGLFLKIEWEMLEEQESFSMLQRLLIRSMLLPGMVGQF
jgi:hypothetical protein